MNRIAVISDSSDWIISKESSHSDYSRIGAPANLDSSKSQRYSRKLGLGNESVIAILNRIHIRISNNNHIEFNFTFTSERGADKAVEDLKLSEENECSRISANGWVTLSYRVTSEQTERVVNLLQRLILSEPSIDIYVIEDMRHFLRIEQSFNDAYQEKLTKTPNQESAILEAKKLHLMGYEDAFYHLGILLKTKYGNIVEAADYFSKVPHSSDKYIYALVERAEMLIVLLSDRPIDTADEKSAGLDDDNSDEGQITEIALLLEDAYVALVSAEREKANEGFASPELEEAYKSAASADKDRISQLYDQMINRAANGRGLNPSCRGMISLGGRIAAYRRIEQQAQEIQRLQAELAKLKQGPQSSTPTLFGSSVGAAPSSSSDDQLSEAATSLAKSSA